MQFLQNQNNEGFDFEDTIIDLIDDGSSFKKPRNSNHKICSQ